MPLLLADHRARHVAALMLLGLLCGCSHLHWPWHRAPAPTPPPVHELDVSGAEAASYPQRWKRNTLLLDLSGASGTGSLTLRPVAGTTWPVRIALRVRPGAFAMLEVQGEQHLTLPINASGAAPVDLELPAGLYNPKTPQLTVSWGSGTAPPS